MNRHNKKSYGSPLAPLFGGFIGNPGSVIGESPINSSGQVNNIIQRGFELAFAAAGIVAVVMIIMGGFKMMTSSGDPQAMQEGQKTLVSGIIGLGVVLTVTLLFNFVVNTIFGVDISIFNLPSF